MGNHTSGNNNKSTPVAKNDNTKTDTNPSDGTTVPVTTGTVTTDATGSVQPEKLVKDDLGVRGGTEETEEKMAVNLIVRREIRSMTDSEQNRVMDAILKMCENKSGPGTSDYFRLAGYHGLPGPYYCNHAIETFPGWHRVYLREFENTLRAADKALGRDGEIFLPYWDWTSNVDGLPSIVRKRFSEWPKDLFPPDFKMDPLKRADDDQIAKAIPAYQIPQEASDCLLAPQHYIHASTGNEWASPYPALESPHNSIHGVVGGNGGQMGIVAYAAFDVIFWMHHCNIDRIYASYLQSNTDSQEEFEKHQQQVGKDKDLYTLPLEPFKKADGSAYYPIDTFHTAHLNYTYDVLPKIPPAQLRERPQLVVFRQVRVDQFESKCYQIHVFIIPKGVEEEFKAPTTVTDVFSHHNYAGSRVIFGRGTECENCVKRAPYDIVIDVSEKMKELQLSRYDAEVKVLLIETTNSEEVFVEIGTTPLPIPILTGSLFEDKTKHLSKNDPKNDEVAALQLYLNRFGYYKGEINGEFDDATEQAVKDFQRVCGLEVNGKVDAETKKAMSYKKRCSNVDGFSSSDIKDEKSLAVDYGEKSNLTYSIGVSPGYLPRTQVVWCVAQAVQQWTDACALTMTYVDSTDEKSSNVDIWYEWSDQTLHEKNVLRFDAHGGVLGEGGNGFVALDSAERWVIGVDKDLQITTDVSSLDDPRTWLRGQPTVSLYHTVLHETGHALGLDHSDNLNDLMAPYYSPQTTKLTESDKNRAAEAWGRKQNL